MSEENTQENTQETSSVTEAVAPVQADTKTETSAAPKPMMAARGARSPRAGTSPRSSATGGARAPFRRGAPNKDGSAPSGARPFRRGGDRGGRKPSFEDRRPEFEQKILSIRRVVRVVSGGRRLSFAVTMIIGDKKGSIGVGTGKSIDTALAIQKALRSAKKNLVKLKLTKEFSISHDVNAKYATSKITMMPNKGRGIVAGSAARDILKIGGLKNVTAKFHSGSKNKLNNARATILALSQFAVKRMPGVQFDAEPKGVEVTEVTTG